MNPLAASISSSAHLDQLNLNDLKKEQKQLHKTKAA